MFFHFDARNKSISKEKKGFCFLKEGVGQTNKEGVNNKVCNRSVLLKIWHSMQNPEFIPLHGIGPRQEPF